MEIVLFDDCAWTDVVAGSDTTVYPATSTRSGRSGYTLTAADDPYGDM